MINIPKEESKYKKIFRRLGVRNIDLARKTGKNFSTVNHYLNGYLSIPIEIQEVFDQYIEELKEKEKQENSNEEK